MATASQSSPVAFETVGDGEEYLLKSLRKVTENEKYSIASRVWLFRHYCPRVVESSFCSTVKSFFFMLLRNVALSGLVLASIDNEPLN